MGVAVTMTTEVVRAELLPTGTSAQKVELIAFTRALRLRREKILNIYTDSRYGFATAHIHEDIYKEGGLLTAEGKTIEDKQEILNLLQAFGNPQSYLLFTALDIIEAQNP